MVEYGGIDTSWDAAIPWLANNVVPGNVMGYTSIPQIGLNNVSSALMVGAVVGGGSQVNGMSFERGSKSDYDSWEDLGNPGWGWDSMFKYFKKANSFHFCLKSNDVGHIGSNTDLTEMYRPLPSLHQSLKSKRSTTLPGTKIHTEMAPSKLDFHRGSGRTQVRTIPSARAEYIKHATPTLEKISDG